MRDEPSGELLARMCFVVLTFTPRHSGRRLIAAGSLVVYLAACVGVPIPTLTPRATEGMSFPCQHHHCGCHTAEHCYRQCCCFTHAERVVWARTHGVDIARFEATNTTPVVKAPARSESGCSHCQADDQGSVASAAETATSNRSSPPGESPKSKVRWTTSIAAAKCQGASSHWLFGFVAVGATETTLCHDFLPTGWIAALPDEFAGVELAPPVPPPRV